MLRTGQPCECGHYLTVIKSEVRGERRVQYLGCRRCGYRPEQNKRVLGLDERSPAFALSIAPRAIA